MYFKLDKFHIVVLDVLDSLVVVCSELNSERRECKPETYVTVTRLFNTHTVFNVHICEIWY